MKIDGCQNLVSVCNIVLEEHQFKDEAHVYYRFVDRAIPENLKVLIGPGSPGSKGSDGRLRDKTQVSLNALKYGSISLV